MNVIFDRIHQQAANAPDSPVIPAEIERAVWRFAAVALELVDFQLHSNKTKKEIRENLFSKMENFIGLVVK